MGRNGIEGRYESRKEGSYEYEVISKRWGGGVIKTQYIIIYVWKCKNESVNLCL